MNRTSRPHTHCGDCLLRVPMTCLGGVDSSKLVELEAIEDYRTMSSVRKVKRLSEWLNDATPEHRIPIIEDS